MLGSHHINFSRAFDVVAALGKPRSGLKFEFTVCLAKLGLKRSTSIWLFYVDGIDVGSHG